MNVLRIKVKILVVWSSLWLNELHGQHMAVYFRVVLNVKDVQNFIFSKSAAQMVPQQLINFSVLSKKRLV